MPKIKKAKWRSVFFFSYGEEDNPERNYMRLEAITDKLREKKIPFRVKDWYDANWGYRMTWVNLEVPIKYSIHANMAAKVFKAKS